MTGSTERAQLVVCPLCLREVRINTRGRLQEHMKPRRAALLPIGCPAGGHSPSAAERMRRDDA